MSFFDLFKGTPKTPAKTPETPKVEPKKKDPGFFGKRGALSRKELRWKLRQDRGKVPGGGFFSRRERERMEKDVFGKKYGSFINEREYKHAMKNLRKEKFRAPTGREKTEIDRKMRFLKKLNDSK